MKKKIGRGVYRNSWGWVNFLNKNNDYREGKKISLVIHYIYTHRSWKYRYTCRVIESREIHLQGDRNQELDLQEDEVQVHFKKGRKLGDTLTERQKVGRYAHRQIYRVEIHLQRDRKQEDTLTDRYTEWRYTYRSWENRQTYRKIESREIQLQSDRKQGDTRL